MSALDMLRGAGIVLFIVVLAGVIAYVGDRIGHQVGRKRLTLFNIRPRYTSTIVAVATGMIIALVVTLGAIFAFNEVKIAFFRLNQINAEITRAQAEARELRHKVTTSRVIVTTDQLMSPLIGHIPVNTAPDRRLEMLRQYYEQVIANINGTYVPQGLKPFKPPAQLNTVLRSFADSAEVQAANSQWPIAMITVSDRNLYINDEIHFQFKFLKDARIFPERFLIASETIPASRNVNIQVALAELESAAASVAVRNGLPQYFVGNIEPVQTYPDLVQMQQMVSSGKGTYMLTAYSATNVYASTGGVPIVVFLQRRAP